MVCFMYLSVCIYIMLRCIITVKLFTNFDNDQIILLSVLRINFERLIAWKSYYKEDFMLKTLSSIKTLH